MMFHRLSKIQRWLLGAGAGLALLALAIGLAAWPLFQGSPGETSFTANAILAPDGGGYGGMAARDATADFAVTEEAAFDAPMAEPRPNGIARPAPPMPAEPTAGVTAAEAPQRLIKTGNLALVVTDVPQAVSSIQARVTGRGGYVESSSVSEGARGERYGYVTVRVPVEEFEPLMAQTADLALRVESSSTNAQDVTEQYTDLEARLKNAREQETAYLEVLEQARSVEDILKVRDYLGRIRGEIEQHEGQLQYLGNRTAYSTVNVNLREEITVELPSQDFAPLTTVKQAVQALIRGLQGLVTLAIWFGITGLGLLLPALLIAGLIWWGIRRRMRRRASAAKATRR
jgi:hypothetical protein